MIPKWYTPPGTVRLRRPRDPDEVLYRRVRNLPHQLNKAREKVARLEAEARQYRMHDLLTIPVLASEAFEREVQIAKLQAGYETPIVWGPDDT
jgi:phage shock protein A